MMGRGLTAALTTVVGYSRRSLRDRRRGSSRGRQARLRASQNSRTNSANDGRSRPRRAPRTMAKVVAQQSHCGDFARGDGSRGSFRRGRVAWWPQCRRARLADSLQQSAARPRMEQPREPPQPPSAEAPSTTLENTGSCVTSQSRRAWCRGHGEHSSLVAMNVPACALTAK
jgi:hypothetical protein